MEKAQPQRDLTMLVMANLGFLKLVLGLRASTRNHILRKIYISIETFQRVFCVKTLKEMARF